MERSTGAGTHSSEAIQMTKATSAKGVRLSVKVGETWKDFEEVKSVPEIGQSADKIDATHLTSEMKEYIPDIPDFSSDLEFVMNAIPHGETDSNYDLIMSLDQDTIYEWKITYPQQKVQTTLKGRSTWKMGGGEISSVQNISLTIIPASAPTWAEYNSVVSLTYEEGTA